MAEDWPAVNPVDWLLRPTPGGKGRTRLGRGDCDVRNAGQGQEASRAAAALGDQEDAIRSRRRDLIADRLDVEGGSRQDGGK